MLHIFTAYKILPHYLHELTKFNVHHLHGNIFDKYFVMSHF